MPKIDLANTMNMLFHLYLLPSLMLIGGVVGKSNGLTLKVIHRDSFESSFILGNLTHGKGIQRLIRQPNTSAHTFSSRSSNDIRSYRLMYLDSKTVRPQIDEKFGFYMVKIGIGTFKSRPSYINYYLHMDTGSSLSWIQCKGCNPCFNHTPAPFPKNDSKSYHPILCEDNHCTTKQCLGIDCSYRQIYWDKDYTSGILAKETFTFNSKFRSVEKVEGITFGCGMNNDLAIGKRTDNKMAGIMGLGWGPLSFVNQISSLSARRFSYCLAMRNPYSHRSPRTYLRFGADIPLQKNLSIIKLLRVEQQAPYYVELKGISINERRLNIDAKVFALRNDDIGSGGCIIDSGTTFTHIIRPAYNILERELQNHFSRFRNLRRQKDRIGICYEREKPEGFRNLPMITFHFEGSNANLVARPDQGLFKVFDKNQPWIKYESFCLTLYPHDDLTIIGVLQQTNHRFIYDTKSSRLFFRPEDCSKNG